MTEPVVLCTAHREELAALLAPKPHKRMSHTLLDQELVEDSRAIVAPPSGPHQRVVYFLVNGNRVKIGHTANLPGRLTKMAMPRSSVALVIAGGRQVEAAMHSRFGALREGRSEWFRLEPLLADYIAAKAAELEPVSDPAKPVAESTAIEARGVGTDEDLLSQAEAIVRSVGYASTSMLQRRLGLGFARAGRLIDKLEAAGVVGPPQGSGRPRDVLARLAGDGAAEAAQLS